MPTTIRRSAPKRLSIFVRLGQSPKHVVGLAAVLVVAMATQVDSQTPPTQPESQRFDATSDFANRPSDTPSDTPSQFGNLPPASFPPANFPPSNRSPSHLASDAPATWLGGTPNTKNTPVRSPVTRANASSVVAQAGLNTPAASVSPVFTGKTSPIARVGAAGEMIGFTSSDGSGSQTITLVHTGKSWMAVYHIDSSGTIRLVSSRPIDADFALQLNATSPLPDDIREMGRR
ncbi:hypothetical protein [Planctomycetes bacterium K23_9]|uniref:Uncharacterized protein n=1 Tax=Stieleria marina TaxID=1930275 RepID=A0A517NP86_9BACT|nr:hypothetical protein K239x_08840 [Planctomycetes bacterium K23_9]